MLIEVVCSGSSVISLSDTLLPAGSDLRVRGTLGVALYVFFARSSPPPAMRRFYSSCDASNRAYFTVYILKIFAWSGCRRRHHMSKQLYRHVQVRSE